MANTKERISNNTTGVAVDLSSYNDTNNRYTFPYDGYVVLNSNNVTSGQIWAVIKGALNTDGPYLYMNITGQYQINSVFVKKGMTVYMVRQPSGTIAQYLPLVSTN